LAYLGKEVLLVDIDPQANATSGIGIDHQKLPHGIYEAIIGQKPIYHVIKHTLQDKYKVAPATVSLAGAGIELVGMEDREFRLAKEEKRLGAGAKQQEQAKQLEGAAV